MKDVFFCPKCEKPLQNQGKAYSCNACGKRFEEENGIILFVVDIDKKEVSYPPAFYEKQIKIERKHFWCVGRNNIILNFLSKVAKSKNVRILEIGCGEGNVLCFLEKDGYHVEGGDILLEGLEKSRSRTDSKLYRCDISHLPFRNSFDIIGAFDILEHIDDDIGALKSVNKALRENGAIILTVPAGKGLLPLETVHKRRYSKKELIDKLKKAGFKVNKISYYMFFLFPIVLIVRWMKSLFLKEPDLDKGINELKIIPIINDICIFLLFVERTMLKYINFPIGVSLIVTAIKENPS